MVETALAVLVAGLTALAYANALSPEFVLDDKLIVPHGRPFDLQNVIALFREDVWAAAGAKVDLYRPLSMLTILFDASTLGRDASGYRVTNILIHVTATLILYALLLALARHLQRRRASNAEEPAPTPAADEGQGWLRRPEVWAALGALAFGLHPIHTESVDSIFNRSAPLSSIFVFGGLWWLWRWIGESPWRAWSGAALLYFLGLLSRESAASFPALAVVLLGLLRLEGPWRARARRLAPVLVLVVPLAGYLAMRHAALSRSAGSVYRAVAASEQIAAPTLVQKLGEAATVLAEFGRMVLWPHPLRALHDDPRAGAGWAWGLLHLAILGLALALLRRVPLVSAAIGFFYLALAPSLRVLTDFLVVGAAEGGTVTDPLVAIAERHAYLPAASLSILLATAGALWSTRAEPSHARAATGPLAAGLIVLSAVFGWLTHARNAAWHDEEALWSAELRVAPTNGNAWMQFTSFLLNQNQAERVNRLCPEAMERAPKHPQVVNNCGFAAGLVGNLSLAESLYLKGIALGAGPVGHVNLGRLYAMQGRMPEMRKQFELAAAAEPNPAMKHVRQGESHLRLDDRRRARAEFEAALAIDPDFAPAKQWLTRVP